MAGPARRVARILRSLLKTARRARAKLCHEIFMLLGTQILYIMLDHGKSWPGNPFPAKASEQL